MESFNVPVASALHVAAGINGDRLPGDGAALVAGEEQRQVGDVLGGGDVTQGDALKHAGPVRLLVDLQLLGHAPDPVAPQLGVDATGHDAVAPDAVLADLE